MISSLSLPTTRAPVTQAIVQADLDAGVNRETIVETSAGIMASEFLGFCPAHVFMVRPDLAGVDVTEVDGQTVETTRFNAGNWWGIDNPEFSS